MSFRRLFLAVLATLTLVSMSFAQSGPAYANVTTFLGAGISDGGTGATISRLIADDITPSGLVVGSPVTNVTFSVFNGSANTVSVRPRIRFWLDSGSNSPGTFIIGFSFNPITFTANTVTLVNTDLTGLGFNYPSGKFWAGVQYDNAGATASAADVDLFGVGLFDPPTVGSSADVLFQSTAAANLNLVNNPAGTVSDLAGALASNAGWSFASVPEPTTWALIFASVTAGLGGAYSYRRKVVRQLDQKLVHK